MFPYLAPNPLDDDALDGYYEEVIDDEPHRDLYEDEGIEYLIERYEEIDYLTEAGHMHFFDLQEWSDEQVLNLQHEKAFKLEMAMNDAFVAGIFEYICWPPRRPNRFGCPSLGLEVCLPSPQHRDPNILATHQILAHNCWNVLFSSNRKSSAVSSQAGNFFST